jgi:uncharacterized membrane protein
MITAIVYYFIALVLLCAAGWFVGYITAVAGMPDPPRRALVFGAWVVVAVCILLAFVYLVVPRLGGLPGV